MKKTLSFLTIAILLGLGAFFLYDNYLKDYIPNIFHLEPIELSVYAPSSLRTPLDKVKEAYQSENPSVTLTISYKSSYEITKDILAGKKPDLAIVASQKDLQQITSKALIAPDTQEVLAKNTVVLIAPVDSGLNSVEGLTSNKIEKIAVGNPDSTSIGHYTTSILKNMGLLNSLEWKFREQKNVQEIVKKVGDKSDEAGIVFRSDALTNPKVKVVAEFPQTTYTPITYTMFETATEKNEHFGNVKALEEYLLSESAQKLLTDSGFTSVVTSKTDKNAK